MGSMKEIRVLPLTYTTFDVTYITHKINSKNIWDKLISLHGTAKGGLIPAHNAYLNKSSYVYF